MTSAVCTDLIPSKGTKISIGSANLASTPVYTEIGLIESFGEFGPDASVGSFVPVGTGIAGKFMGATDNGDVTISIAKTLTDTGLTELIAAQKSNSPLAYKIELSNGTTYTFNGLCRSCRVNVGGPDDVVKINAVIAITGTITTA